MDRLKPTHDARTTYDPKNGAVRSFHGSELVEPPPAVAGAAPAADRPAHEKAGSFLAANKDLFKLQDIPLQPAGHRVGAATESLRYRQEHDTIPVYGGEIVVGVEAGGRVASAVNKVDYDIPANLTRAAVKLTAAEAAEVAKQQIAPLAGAAEPGLTTLYVYRYQPPPTQEPPAPMKADRAKIAAVGSGKAGEAYLAWQVLLDTKKPDGNWAVFVDAGSGRVIAVKDRRRYASVKGFVYMPDPITTSSNAALSSATGESTLNPQRQEVDVENLEEPVGGVFKLVGKWAASRDIESPTLAPPSTTTDFKFGAKDRKFLSVMAYYWVDRVITYLRGFGVTTFNQAVELQRISLDAQGVDGDDNSHFTLDNLNRPYLAFGEGGVPDAADAHVVVHEYAHAMHFYLGTDQNSDGSEEGFGDFLGGAWLDRFSTTGFQRGAGVFPWDNNASAADHYSNDRFFNTPRKFSDANYNSLSIHVKGSVLAATLWDLFIALGGNTAAADAVVRIYMEMLVAVPREAGVTNLAKGMVTADAALNGGANGTAIKAAFAARGMAI